MKIGRPNIRQHIHGLVIHNEYSRIVDIMGTYPIHIILYQLLGGCLHSGPDGGMDNGRVPVLASEPESQMGHLLGGSPAVGRERFGDSVGNGGCRKRIAVQKSPEPAVPLLHHLLISQAQPQTRRTVRNDCQRR